MSEQVDQWTSKREALVHSFTCPLVYLFTESSGSLRTSAQLEIDVDAHAENLVGAGEIVSVDGSQC